MKSSRLAYILFLIFIIACQAKENIYYYKLQLSKKSVDISDLDFIVKTLINDNPKFELPTEENSSYPANHCRFAIYKADNLINTEEIGICTDKDQVIIFAAFSIHVSEADIQKNPKELILFETEKSLVIAVQNYFTQISIEFEKIGPVRTGIGKIDQYFSK